MAVTDTSEKGLEALIVESLVSQTGYVQGRSEDYDRDHAVDLVQLQAFVSATQPETAEALGLDEDASKRIQFLHRIQGEIAKRGVIDVLRGGVKHGPIHLDLGVFINGLPVATFELKNRLTKQTIEDAVQQYKRDRDPKELLFQFGRCMVHFAVDDQEVRMCTHLKGKDSWFLPFNKGYSWSSTSTMCALSIR